VLIVASVLAAIGAEAWYLVAVHTGTTPDQAAAVLQPATLVWSVAAVTHCSCSVVATPIDALPAAGSTTRCESPRIGLSECSSCIR